MDLPPGPVFWRVRTNTAISPTWQFHVGTGTGATNGSTTWGTVFDFNGDGYADVIQQEITQDYIRYLTLVAGDPGSLLAQKATVQLPPGHNMWQGEFADAGDVNGDGYSDLVLHETYYLTVDKETFDIFYGGPNGPGAAPSAQIVTPLGEGGEIPWAAGDINGDGYADLVWGSMTRSDSVYHLYVCYGGPNGLPASPSVDVVVSSAYALPAGDVNGDGYSDVVIGDSLANTAYVYRGSANGLLMTAPIALHGVDTGSFVGFGEFVSGAGDVDNDGYADVLVGSDGVTGAYVFRGGPLGINTTGLHIVAPSWPLAAAGDINGDGFADILMGGSVSTGENQWEARLYVALGGPSTVSAPVQIDLPKPTTQTWDVRSTGDINGDGYADFFFRDLDQYSYNVDVFQGGSANVTLMRVLLP
jgi:hypothetical protein